VLLILIRLFVLLLVAVSRRRRCKTIEDTAAGLLLLLLLLVIAGWAIGTAGAGCVGAAGFGVIFADPLVPHAGMLWFISSVCRHL
jgi:hypothetical protein